MPTFSKRAKMDAHVTTPPEKLGCRFLLQQFCDSLGCEFLCDGSMYTNDQFPKFSMFGNKGCTRNKPSKSENVVKCIPNCTYRPEDEVQKSIQNDN